MPSSIFHSYMMMYFSRPRSNEYTKKPVPSNSHVLNRCGRQRTCGRFLVQKFLRPLLSDVKTVSQSRENDCFKQCPHWSYYSRFERSQYPTFHFQKFDSFCCVFRLSTIITPTSLTHSCRYDRSCFPLIFGM